VTAVGQPVTTGTGLVVERGPVARRQGPAARRRIVRCFEHGTPAANAIEWAVIDDEAGL